MNGTPGLLGWGFYAHKEITKSAVTYLPDSIAVWYQKNQTEIVNRSIEPDQNRYTDKTEIPRHYIDLEDYQTADFKSSLMPFHDFKLKYRSEILLKSGYVPYVILDYMDSLTQAISVQDERQMIKFSAYLSHYISDINVPFHTTVFYDGKGTTKGIHSRFEADLAERILVDFKHKESTAEYADNMEQRVFSAMKKSYQNVEFILNADSLIQYDLGIAGKKNKERFDDEYYDRLNEKIGSVVRDQVSVSSKMVADFWLTCWVNASKKTSPLN